MMCCDDDDATYAQGTTASETEALELPVREFVTVCHVRDLRTLDISYKLFKTLLTENIYV